ncbi:MAG: hypothetical protein ACQEP1_03785 [Nanobdellota archaeon]
MMKKYTEEEVQEIRNTFYEEIKRRDKKIDELKKSNDILMKTALKNTERETLQEELKKKK